ncbi:MAG: GspH/FimT family pseudopilin [Stagnimonas sp.]|nr:GspH/FimT family pseudopilin [Stagnimonas sp.]
MRTAQIGFTLMELLVVIAIAGILTGIAIPSFRSMMQGAESRQAATSFYTGLARARSEAIARNSVVSICARDLSNPQVPACASGGSSWQDGWIIYQGTTLGTALQIQGPLPHDLALTGVSSPLAFDAAGRVGTAATFDLCRAAPDPRGRQITVSRSGRVALDLHPCS